MKRFTLVVGMLVLVAAFYVQAADQTKHDMPGMTGMTAKETAKTVSVTGEIVDMGCYLAEGAHGEQHKSCATMCLSGGMPMGLLTSDGKLYLLTMSHDNADPFNSAKKMAAEQVTITGVMEERNGVKALQVNEIKSTAAEQPAKAAPKQG